MDKSLEVLVKKLKVNDQSAFEKIYQATYRQIFFVILPILRDKSLAEDIVQDTYMKFLEKLDEYKSKNLLSYLITIAKNLSINEYNKRLKTTKIDDYSEFSYFDYIEFKTENKEAVTKALSVLSEIEKNIFLLHVLEDLTFIEISKIIDKPLGTVSWLYAKSRQKMINVLKGDNYEV